MTKNQLKILRQSLPKGIEYRLANEFKLSKPYIHSILYGMRPKPEVIDRAIEIAEEEKVSNDAIEQKRMERILKLNEDNQLKIKFK